MNARPDSSTPAAAVDGRSTGGGTRGCFGCLTSGGLGCGAFVFGAMLAVALFAPQLLGGWAARFGETWLTRRVDGRVTIGGAELSWGDGTRLREVALIDATGKELLRGSLRGPSLSELSRGFEGSPPQLRARLQSAHLGIDAERGLDLAHTLRWRGLRPLAELWRQDPADERPEFFVSIDAREVRVVDARPGGAELVLTDLLLDLERAVGARATNFTLTCGVAEPVAGDAPRGSLDLSFQVSGQDQALPGAVALRLRADDLPVHAARLLIEALLGGFDAELPDALTSLGMKDLAGSHLDLELSVRGDVQSGADVALSLTSERGLARFTGRVLAGVLTLGMAPRTTSSSDAAASAASEVRWQVPPELVQALLAPHLPTAWQLGVAGPDGAAPSIRARGDALTLDTGFGRGWAPDFALVELSADIPCAGALSVDVTRGASGATVAEAPPEATARIVARDPLVLVRWLGPLGGSVTAHWRTEGPGAELDGAPWLGSATMRFDPALGDDAAAKAVAAPTFDVDLPGLPVELLRVAASLPAEGAALLGERVRVQVTGLRRGGAGENTALDFALYAGVGRVPVRGRVEGGVARAAGGRPQSLSFPGDRATLTRLLGPVLPWIDSFEAAGPGPITVTFTDLVVPLDGGTLRPHGSLEFAPPALRVRLGAPIAALFGQGDTAAWSSWHPRKLYVELNDELVRYASIELPIEGEHFPFAGSFDRATREVNLKGDVPMRVVPARELDSTELAQLLVDSDVPVLVSGPIGSPKLYIDWDSTRRVFTNRLEAALGEVVPAMRDALGQIVPRTSETPEPAAKPEGEQTPPREPPPAAGGG